ncbi:hypothetical protein GJU40_09555 [Bacillus lacus]|uniref:Uncharacterized protein n=1 Tax=Metabacillus lacus TaxID=1983721 RepID=A0A7X2LXC2_9BACI|nr:DUF6154 family protein [Metabacillus lacus]MRX72395.1 hypothetical protein [Metabacillus lacus]
MNLFNRHADELKTRFRADDEDIEAAAIGKIQHLNKQELLMLVSEMEETHLKQIVSNYFADRIQEEIGLEELGPFSN